MNKTILILVIGGLLGVGAVNYYQYITFQIPKPVATLVDGAIYEGDMLNGVIEGQGRMLWNSGDRYEGSFKNGLAHGQGRFEGVDGTWYEGAYSEGAITGVGTMYYSEEQQYTGEMKFARMHGKGVLKSYGTLYDGEFLENKFHGEGKYMDDQGNTYTGEFEGNKFHGKGVYVSAGGGRYEGEFVLGNFSGRGAYSNEEGVKYEGYFKDWLYHGKGKLVDEKGDQYFGGFQNGTLKGRGEHIAADGAHYQGEFDYDMYHGRGELTTAKGDVYKGEFYYGEYSGKGTLTYAKALEGIKQVSGTWRYGKLIESKDKGVVVNSNAINETVLYNQEELLEKSWHSLEQNDPQSIDMYFLGISGDGSQAVFRREIQFVRNYFNEAFAIQGKSIALINARKTINDIPLATNTSIKRSLGEIARRMDTENDILFLFMSSHGSKEHAFSLKQAAMDLPDLSAEALAGILADLPIRWKVIVISACYSGGFIQPLKDDHTLIITAASAEQTSFGCSDEAEFTYFGEAYFKDALSQTHDFAEAFDIARDIVKEREKVDGYEHSEPRIHKPRAILEQLERWREGLSNTQTVAEVAK
jgi:hypothetical protein